MNIFKDLEHSLYISQKELLILRILKEYNCRISEVLEARWEKFYSDNFLVLQGKKGSRDIIIRDPDILKMIEQLPKHSEEFIFYPTKYFQIHRLCIKYLNDKVLVYKKRKNRKTTHYFRYAHAAILDNDKELSVLLHHQGQRSVGFYKQNSKGK